MKILTPQAGFTIIETLVSITILLMVIVGPLAITSNAAKSSSFSSEQVVAFFLAQEGAELVQKARDDLQLTGALDVNSDPLVFTPSNPDPWADFTRTSGVGLYNQCYTMSGCDLSINTDNTGTLLVTSCSNIDNCRLYLDTVTNNQRNRYNHTDTNTPTPFTRVITLQPTANPNEIKVISKVTWRTGSIRDAQEVVVETHVFNVYGTQ